MSDVITKAEYAGYRAYLINELRVNRKNIAKGKESFSNRKWAKITRYHNDLRKEITEPTFKFASKNFRNIKGLV